MDTIKNEEHEKNEKNEIKHTDYNIFPCPACNNYFETIKNLPKVTINGITIQILAKYKFATYILTYKDEWGKEIVKSQYYSGYEKQSFQFFFNGLLNYIEKDVINIYLKQQADYIKKGFYSKVYSAASEAYKKEVYENKGEWDGLGI